MELMVKRWNAEDLAILENSFKAGKTAVLIAKDLHGKFTSDAVRRKWKSLNFSRKDYPSTSTHLVSLVWTPDKDNQMIGLIKSGMSAAQCGLVMNISRNAIIGRIFRRRLADSLPDGFAVKRTPEENEARAARAAEKRRLSAEARKRKAERKQAEREPGAPRAKRKPTAIPIEPTPDTAVSFRELERFGCRWIYGEPAGPDTAFCGHPQQEDCSYCAAHYKRTIQSRNSVARARIRSRPVYYVGHT